MTEYGDNGGVWQVTSAGNKTLLATSPNPSGVLALPQYDLLLWGDNNPKSKDDVILQKPLTVGGPKTEFMAGVRNVIALDYVEASDTIVWVDYSANTVESCHRNGTGRKTIHNLGSRFLPYDIVVVER